MNTINIKLYNIVRKEFNLSEDKAVEFVQAVEEATFENSKMGGSEYHSLIKEDMVKLETNLKKDITDLRIEMYKAVFIAGFFQIVAIIGALVAILKFMLQK